MREALASLLKEAGWEAQLCAELNEVTPALLRREVDLVLTAAIFPGGDYGDVLQRFRDGAVSGAFPVLLLTDATDAKTVSTALVKGVTEVFSRNNLRALRAYLETLNASERGALKGTRALVLDDDVTMGLYLGQVLGELGMSVDRHVDLNAALAAISATSYDLVIADIVLGGGESGNHFIRLLRQSPVAARTVPVIALSGYTDSARRLDALRAGANIYLAKPVTEEELLLTVRRLLGEEVAPAETLVDATGKRLFELSRRELAISHLIISGLSDKRIAEQLGISYWTVRTHLASIFRKCAVMNRVELAHLLRRSEGRGNDESGAAMLGSHGLAQAVLTNFQNAVLVADKDRKIIYVNPAFSRITGYAEEEVLGKTPSFLSSDKYTNEFYLEMLRQLQEEGGWSGEIWDRHKNGGLFLAWLDIRRLPPGAPLGACYSGVIADITGRNDEFDRVRHYALHDALTGLGNRTLLENRWTYEMARSRRSNGQLALLFIDLDRFKSINDSVGHEIGDHLLAIAAGRIRSSARDNDTVVRYGGDEFVVLVPDLADADSALTLANKILAAVNVPVEHEGVEYRLGASIGISVFPENGKELDTLVSRADAAMYRAKEAGGNVAHFYVASQGRSTGMRNCLEAALGRGDLELCFQRRVNVTSSTLVGAASLLRWSDPERSSLEPPLLAALGEGNHHSVDVFDWMLQRVCGSLRLLQKQCHGHFCLALKVPSVQLLRRNFVPELAAALARNGVAAEHLQLEIAEAAWQIEPEQVRAALGQLREMRVSLALEGFGAANSRLLPFKGSPFDTLKLDPELVRKLPGDRYSTSIASALVQMAGDLGLRVVADGVDSHGVLAHLQQLGCHLAQGALFGEPWSEAQLAEQLLPS